MSAVYSGTMKPADAEERVTIFIEADENHLVTKATFDAEGGERLKACAETLCEQLLEKDVRDFFQMTNNVIYYNIEPDLRLNELYLASIAVMAAKRAAADYCRKNGIAFDAGTCCCV